MADTPMHEMDQAAFMAEVRRRATSDRYRVPNFAVRRLLAALDKALKLAGELTGDAAPSSAFEEDRAWVRAECAARFREAIARELAGGEKADG